jgi:DNA-binding NarL/FixJ family response regulator
MGPFLLSADQPEPTSLRVVVVGNDLLARAGLASLLQDATGLEVVAQLPSDDSLQSSVSAYQPDALVWDVGWSDETNPWQENVNEQVERGVRIVALLADPSQAAEAWASGVRAMLSREASPTAVSAAVRAVLANLIAMEPGYSRLPGGDFDLPLEALTDRELEVLALLAEGLSNRAIAFQLEISEHTVKFHVNGILRKLGAQSRTEAVVRATRMGLILL